MNQAYLKNILSARFDFDIWKDLLEKIFPKVEIFTSVTKITDSHVKDGGHIGNIRLDDRRSLALFRFEVADNVQMKVCRNTRCAFFFFIDYKNRLIFLSCDILRISLIYAFSTSK